MRRHAAVIWTVAVLALFGGLWAWNQLVPIAQQRQETTEAAAAKRAKAHRKVVTIPVATPKAKPSAARVTEIPAATPPSAAHNVGLRLEEEIIREMEINRDHLRDYAFTEQTSVSRMTEILNFTRR